MVTTIQKSVYYFRYSELEIFDIIQFVIKLLIQLQVTLAVISSICSEIILNFENWYS